MRWLKLIEQNFEVMGTAGDEVICRCPWHEDEGKPNLYINAVKGVYICHACHVTGHLSKLYKNLPPRSTGDVRQRLKKLRQPPAVEKRYPESWLKSFDFPHEYWTDVRGLSDDAIEKFSLGYDPIQDQLTIPIRDSRGRVLGVVRRVLDGSKPKYIEPKGVMKSRHLYGSWLLKKSHRRVALVEGPMDTISCWDARIPALGLMGSRLTHDQFMLLQKLNVQHVVVLTDNDRAGQGFPEHKSIPEQRRGNWVCAICGKPSSPKSRSTHKATGIWQIREMITGIIVSVGIYRPYWTGKDPADLTPQQRRKMYHSAKSFREWAKHAV